MSFSFFIVFTLHILAKLEVLNPLLTIKRGYSVVRSQGKVIDKAKDAKKGDVLELEFQDGKIESKVL